MASSQHFQCSPCHLDFNSWVNLWDHKCLMRFSGREDHKKCSFCPQKFETVEAELLHVQQYHQQSQELHCPGCGRGPFARAGALVAHIERGQCTRIGSSDLAKMRETKIEALRALESHSTGPIKANFANYMSERPVEQWNDVVEAPSEEHPGEVTVQDFPALDRDIRAGKANETKATKAASMAASLASEWLAMPLQVHKDEEKRDAGVEEAVPQPLVDKWHNSVLDNSKDTKAAKAPATKTTESQLAGQWRVPLLRQNKSTNVTAVSIQESQRQATITKLQNAWGSKDVQESLTKDRQTQRITPAAEQLAAATAPAPKAPVDALELHDPRHPHFNASRYWCELAGKFVCPKLGCGKCFKSKNAIVEHLRSPAHGDQSYQCPRCLRMFKSAAAIISHAESAGRRCQVREADDYGAFLDQITGGIVQLDLDAATPEGPRYRVEKTVMGEGVW